MITTTNAPTSVNASINPMLNYTGSFQKYKLTTIEKTKNICSKCDNKNKLPVYISKLCTQCAFKKTIGNFSKLKLYSDISNDLNATSSIQKGKQIPLEAKDKSPRATFSFELLNLLRESKNSNVIISPQSIINALTLLFLGTSGTTKQELGNLFDKIDVTVPESLLSIPNTIDANDSLLPNYLAQVKEEDSRKNSWVASIFNKFGSSVDEDARLDNFNSVLTAEGLPLSKNMKKRLAILKAVAGDQVLSSNNFIEDINEAFAIKTNGDVKEIVKKEDFIGADIAILNAIHFHGKWKSAFTRDGYNMRFNLSAGKSTPVESMSLKTTNYKEASLGNWQAIRLFYKGDKYAMDIILPSAEVATENNDGKTSGVISKLTSLLNNEQPTSSQKEISIQMPLFSFSSETNLLSIMIKHPELKSLWSQLNLNEMIEGGYVGAINQVLQKCYIDVNESDTTATVVTKINISRSISRVKKFYVDRPFYFSLVNTENNDIAMAGFVQNPSLKK
jgi:serine protease inhibitor